MIPLHSITFGVCDLAKKIESGSAALFPTDTVPALGASPFYASQLWDIKKRPSNKPLILMGASSQEVLDFVAPYALDDAWDLAKKYWPGALTMVLPCRTEIIDNLNPGNSSLGLRVPANNLTRELLSKTGPLATTSANMSGVLPSLSAEQTSSKLPDIPILGPLPWSKGSGLASTIISWQNRNSWILLREGALKFSQLCDNK